MDNTIDRQTETDVTPFLLSPELIKQCNPGLTDFGTGNIVVLSSQCLRSAEQPSDCDICIEACPAKAIRADTLQRPTIARDCLKCGLCIGVCPVNALAATARTHQQIIRTILQSTLRTDQVTITCQRSLALLRLEAQSLDPGQAQSALELLASAETNNNLYTVSCLALLTRESWFMILNEIGLSLLNEACIFLPVGQCTLCPVNSLDNVEKTFSRAIDIAEQWSGQTFSLVLFPDEVPQYQKPDIRGYLTTAGATDRREIFTGLADELRRSWDETDRTRNRAADETLQVRARREAIQTTRLADDQRVFNISFDKPILAATRQTLVEAVGRNHSNADRVVLLVSQTDQQLCNGCGVCLKVCPVHARQWINPAPAKTNAEQPNTDVPDQIIGVDVLYCLGCSACIQQCPENACDFTQVSGRVFLK
jgi:ferredoxin